MTSCVFSVFFFISLVSSHTVLANAGLKLRMTNHAQPVLRDLLVTLLRQLENRNINGATITNLMVNENQVTINFIENTGVNINMRDVTFTLASIPVNNIDIDVTLNLVNQENGSLKVLMPECSLRPTDVGQTGWIRSIWNGFKAKAGTVFCALIRWLVLPEISNTHSIKRQAQEEGPEIMMDLSLTRDVQVTANYFELSVQGLMYIREAPAPEIQGEEPVINENDLMAYVGVTESVLNSAAASFYRAGTLMMEFDKFPNKHVHRLMKLKKFFMQPWNLNVPYTAKVEITEAPTFNITRANGVSFNLRVKLTAKPDKEGKKGFLSVTTVCQVDLRFHIGGQFLNLPSENIKCKIVTKDKIRDGMVKPLNTLLSNKAENFLASCFSDGVYKIPLPPGFNFIQGQIIYHDGFMVFGGSLGLNENRTAIANNIINKLLNE
ncbi:hypothetical protein PAMA_019939 [Pampus argenteus]